MKKIVISCAVLGLTACATTTNNYGLTHLYAEPTNCEFLYNLDSSVTTYNLNDAYDYVEKTIVERGGLGNAYYIGQEDVIDNVNRAMFAPEHIYKLKAKVYNCKK